MFYEHTLFVTSLKAEMFSDSLQKTAANVLCYVIIKNQNLLQKYLAVIKYYA